MTADMIELLVPNTVRTCSRREPIDHRHLPADHPPGITKRGRQEFATVRWCARSAINALGRTPQPVTSSSSGAPIWQTGIVGSITHCDGYYAAAVALTEDVKYMGIDAEENVPLHPMVMQRVASEEEISMISRLPSQAGGPIWERVLISAKEAAFKATSPLLSQPVGWWRYAVEINTDGRWTAIPPPNLVASASDPVRRLFGRWALDRKIVVTTITIPHRKPRHDAGTIGQS